MDSNHRSPKGPVFVAEGELRNRTGAAKKGCFLYGTDGSNPSPSSGESSANLILLETSKLPNSAGRVVILADRPGALAVSAAAAERCSPLAPSTAHPAGRQGHGLQTASGGATRHGFFGGLRTLQIGR